MRLLLVLVLLIFFASTSATDQAAKKTLNFLAIGDIVSACEEGKRQTAQFPDSEGCWAAYIQALASQGNEVGMLKAWSHYAAHFPNQSENRHLLDCMAWGVINKGAKSPSPIVRIYALLGAFFGQDARGVKIMRGYFNDSTAYIRAVALQLASRMRDPSLQEEVLRRLKEEKHVQVRIAAIKAVGKMKIRRAEKELLAILSENGVRAEEKEAAIESLVDLFERVDTVEISRLALHSRASLRELAANVLLQTEKTEEIGLILPLLRDPCSDVRQAAITVLGRIGLKEWKGIDLVDHMRRLASDPQPKVAIAAARALTLHEPITGKEAFEKWLTHSNRDYRLFAAAALASTGHYGTALAARTLLETQDPLVKVNLALGLIAQPDFASQACMALSEGLKSQERWMWQKIGGLQVLAPSTVHYSGLIPNQPEAVDQMIRLEVLNVLALMEAPQALSAVRDFLQKTHWGISGAASSLLLQEGDQNAVDLVQSLLEDSQPKVRIQAALILALWGQGAEAIQSLEAEYPAAHREMKEKILEGMGFARVKASIPFLVEKMGEASPTLRLIAASSLLQCLYH